jgi:hypothetical protein
VNDRHRLIGPERMSVAGIRLRFAAALVLVALATLTVVAGLLVLT